MAVIEEIGFVGDDIRRDVAVTYAVFNGKLSKKLVVAFDIIEVFRRVVFKILVDDEGYQ